MFFHVAVHATARFDILQVLPQFLKGEALRVVSRVNDDGILAQFNGHTQRERESRTFAHQHEVVRDDELLEGVLVYEAKHGCCFVLF